MFPNVTGNKLPFYLITYIFCVPPPVPFCLTRLPFVMLLRILPWCIQLRHLISTRNIFYRASQSVRTTLGRGTRREKTRGRSRNWKLASETSACVPDRSSAVVRWVYEQKSQPRGSRQINDRNCGEASEARSKMFRSSSQSPGASSRASYSAREAKFARVTNENGHRPTRT